MIILLRIKKIIGLISHEKFDEKMLLRKVKKSGLFDKKYYLKKYPDIAKSKVNPIKHYLKYGWKECRNPSPRFDTKAYLDNNPDVKNANVCPLLHYINCGKKEGRLSYTVPGEKIKRTFKENLQYAWEYPIRVHEKYHKLKDEIRNLKNSK